jgi:aspartokinase
MDYRELDRLEETGTSVLGKSQTTLYRNPDELSRLTFVGETDQLASMQQVLSKWQAEGRIMPSAISMSSRFICFFLPSCIADESYSRLHELLSGQDTSLKNLSIKGGIGELRLHSAHFVDDPSGLAELTGLLANNRIKTIEIVTGLTDISLFVPYEDLDRAEDLLRRVLEHYRG